MLDSRLRGNEREAVTIPRISLRFIRATAARCSGRSNPDCAWRRPGYAWQAAGIGCGNVAMSPTVVKPRTKLRPKTKRPPLWKVILLNDDYTPREFVVQVLKAVFRMNADQAYRVMMTAHRRGACVIAVYAKDVADTKAKEATELGKSKGYPLFFTTEPEE